MFFAFVQRRLSTIKILFGFHFQHLSYNGALGPLIVISAWGQWEHFWASLSVCSNCTFLWLMRGRGQKRWKRIFIFQVHLCCVPQHRFIQWTGRGCIHSHVTVLLRHLGWWYMRIGLISIYNFFIGMVGLHWVNKALLSSFYDEKEIQVDEEPD